MDTSKFVSGLSYYQKINLTMALYMANDSSLTRKAAYERAVVNFSNEEETTSELNQMINLGPVLRS